MVLYVALRKNHLIRSEIFLDKVVLQETLRAIHCFRCNHFKGVSFLEISSKKHFVPCRKNAPRLSAIPSYTQGAAYNKVHKL